MKTSPYLLGCVLVGLYAQNSSLAQAPTADDLNHGLQIDVDDVNDIATFSWWGVSGETYFMQVSPDLTSGWDYVDHIYSGVDDELGHSFAVNSDKFFFRLKYTDQPSTDPENDDFDLDGIGNLAELTQDTDPFGWEDLNANQIPDDWETYYAGLFSVYSAPLEETLLSDTSHSRDIFLSNDTVSSVNYSITLTPEATIPEEYTWTDSLTGNATYTWNDISGTGIRLDIISNSDEESEKITLSQFVFPLYDNDYSEIWISSNGFINFLNKFEKRSNSSLPYNPGDSYGIGGEGMIAAFWDDLNPAYSGDIYYKEFSDRVVIQYDNVEDRGRSGYFTFQIVLHATGEIDFIYNQLTGDVDSCTVGLQDIDYSRATQVIINENYLQSNMAIRLELAKRSLTPFGYAAEDSLTGSIVHSWTDISSTGALMTVVSNEDDGSEKITLTQFSFPHYGVEYSEIWVASNGYLNLLNELNQWGNTDLPSSNYVPWGLIAPFWDDLNPSGSGSIYYQETTDRLIVQYDNVIDYDETGFFTFQVVLHSSGKIEFIYNQMGGLLESATIGTQNVDRDTATVVAYNESYLQSNMTVVLEEEFLLFDLAPSNGSVAATTVDTSELLINQSWMVPGRHKGVIEIIHDGGGSVSPWLIPYDFLIFSDSDGDDIADEWLEDVDADGLIDGWEYQIYGYLGVNHTKDSDGDGVYDYQDANIDDDTVGLLLPSIAVPMNGGTY